MLSKDYSLKLNYEEVDELLDIVERGLESLLWDLVVSFRADGVSDARADGVLCGKLSESDDCSLLVMPG